MDGAREQDPAGRRGRVAAMLEHHWVAEGYAAPNAQVYPWQWLWDSCFHALIWAELGRPDRAVRELERALSTQDDHGFVAHMNYERDPGFHADFWGRRGASSITQPPMYGHALAELVRRGTELDGVLVGRAERGLRFLLERRRRDEASGLLLLAHPWETGCDDSPRWDDLCPGGWDLPRWYARKGELVASVETDDAGSPIGNHAMHIASAGFNALVAYNARELGEAFGIDHLVREADALAARLDDRWDPGQRTWADAGETAAGSGRARTLDGLLGALVTADPALVATALGDALDDAAHGGRFGPAGVHRAEPTFSASTYWRGPAWPQLSYLLWRAARRPEAPAGASAELARRTVAGADLSGLAEYWDPDTGRGLGAIPQSWTGLCEVVAGVEGLA